MTLFKLLKWGTLLIHLLALSQKGLAQLPSPSRDSTHQISVIVLDSLREHQKDSLQKFLEGKPTQYLPPSKVNWLGDFTKLNTYFFTEDSLSFYNVIERSFPLQLTKENKALLFSYVCGRVKNYDVLHLQKILAKTDTMLLHTLNENGGIDNKYGYATREAVLMLTVAIEGIIEEEMGEKYTQLFLKRYEPFNMVFILSDASGSNKNNTRFPFQLTKYLKRYLENNYQVYIKKFGMDDNERAIYEAQEIFKQLALGELPLDSNQNILIEIHTDEPDATGRYDIYFDEGKAAYVCNQLKYYTNQLIEKGCSVTISYAIYQYKGMPKSDIVKLFVFNKEKMDDFSTIILEKRKQEVFYQILRKSFNGTPTTWWDKLPTTPVSILDAGFK